MAKPVLYRCPIPTDSLCSCGGAAKALRKAGVEFESRKLPYSRSKRPEIVELTGQKRVPVLIDGDEVVHDSKRIKQYIERRWSTRYPKVYDRGTRISNNPDRNRRRENRRDDR